MLHRAVSPTKTTLEVSGRRQQQLIIESFQTRAEVRPCDNDAWVLQGSDARAAAAALGWAETDVKDIDTFKQTLTERLVAAAAPE